MKSIFAIVKAIWDVMKLIKEIKKYFDLAYIKRLEEEILKEKQANDELANTINTELDKPADQRNNDAIRDAIRKRNGTN